jgi:2-polyprenyl-6-methoxyphenol hydroxylase-like FAD-dependent oxidoreductase
MLLVRTRIDANNTATEETKETGEEYLRKYGRRKVGITWHNMQQLLASLLPDDTVMTGRSLISFVEEPDSVLLHFENGSTVRAEAVLACDGVFSVARRQLFPDDSPIFFGQLNWSTIIETSKLPTGMHPPNAVHTITYAGQPRWMSMLNDGGNGYTFWQFRVADPVKALAYWN